MLSTLLNAHTHIRQGKQKMNRVAKFADRTLGVLEKRIQLFQRAKKDHFIRRGGLDLAQKLKFKTPLGQFMVLELKFVAGQLTGTFTLVCEWVHV